VPQDRSSVTHREPSRLMARRSPLHWSSVCAFLAVTFLAALTAGCDDSLEATGRERNRLTYEQLAAAAAITRGPVNNAYFMPMGEHGEALHDLAGTLEVKAETRPKVEGGFPAFKVRFFTHNGHLVPVERDIIKGLNGSWDLILSPGRVWSESGDDGWSRASFPFVLAGRVWNESHNGLATFLYNDTEVTGLVVQIVEEAASWNRFDDWAELTLEYRRQDIAGLDRLKADFETELVERIPIKRWEDLPEKPDRNPLASFDGTAVHVTVSGLVIDGTFYGQPCRTRHGDYPYCGEMRHGVYSVTKTAGAGLSLFWLAQVYGEEVYDEKIADYLDVTAKHDGWDEVTFLDALNMMTGIGDLAPDRNTNKYVFEVDDEAPILDTFAAAPGARAMLDVAFSTGNYPWGPGEVGRYNSIHTFVLAAAMDAYLKEQEGPQANLWDAVIENVLKPIGVRYAPMMHSREADGSRGVPIMGYGYFPTIGELAKIAQLFKDRGAHNGRQLIDGNALSQLFDETEETAYTIPWDNDDGRYRYGRSFWFMPFEADGGCSYLVPEMIGFGGNIVLLLPTDMIAIRFADGPDDTGGNPNGESMAAFAEEIHSLCD